MDQKKTDLGGKKEGKIMRICLSGRRRRGLKNYPIASEKRRKRSSDIFSTVGEGGQKMTDLRAWEKSGRGHQILLPMRRRSRAYFNIQSRRHFQRRRQQHLRKYLMT